MMRVLSIVMALLGLFFAHVSYDRAKLPYNSAGRFLDGLVIYHDSAVVFYALAAITSMVVALILMLVARAKRKRVSGALDK